MELYKTAELLRQYKEESETERMALSYDWYESAYFLEGESLHEWIHQRCLDATLEVYRNLEHWIENYNYYFDIYLDSEEGKTNDLPNFDRTLYNFFDHVAYIVHRESYYHNYRNMVAVAIYEEMLAKEHTITLAQHNRMESHIDQIVKTGIFEDFKVLTS